MKVLRIAIAALLIAAAGAYIRAADQATLGSVEVKYVGTQGGVVSIVVMNPDSRPADIVDSWVNITNDGEGAKRLRSVVKLQLPFANASHIAGYARSELGLFTDTTASQAAAIFKDAEVPPGFCSVVIHARQPKWHPRNFEFGVPCRALLYALWPSDGRTAFPNLPALSDQ